MLNINSDQTRISSASSRLLALLIRRSCVLEVETVSIPYFFDNRAFRIPHGSEELLICALESNFSQQYASELEYDLESVNSR